MVSSIQVNALTKTYIGIARVITSPVEIINTANPTQKAITEAIWDTGATNSVITKGLAAKLGLVASGQGLVKGVHGTKMVPVYPVKIILNNQNVSFILPVTECDDLTADGSSEFLIGMDIISKGDFSITNFGGNTVMTYRVPSIEKIDFVHPLGAQTPRPSTNPGRNDKCPCGSGKKYKHCHGA